MKKLALALTALGFLQAQELEVEGDLKVQGNIDASNQRVTNVGSPTDLQDAVNTEFLQDALRDDNTYEFTGYKVRINGNSDGVNDWVYLNNIDQGSWNVDFFSELNQKMIEGWSLHSHTFIGLEDQILQSTSHSYFIFLLKRPLSE